MKRNRMYKSYKPRNRVVCLDCGESFSALGMHNHQRSKRCSRLKATKHIREEALSTKARLREAGKRPVMGQVANAIIGRQLQDLTGFEVAETGCTETTTGIESYKEYWAWDWVARLWHLYRVDNATAKFYARLSHMNTLSEEDKEAEIGLILLRIQGSQ